MSGTNFWTTAVPFDPSNAAITGGTSLWEDGAEATPSVAGKNDPDTGLFWPGSNTLSFATNGDTAMSLAAYNLKLSSSGGLQWTAGDAAAGQDTNISRQAAGRLVIMGATALPAGGSANLGLCFSSTSAFGVYVGSGVPTLSAAQGSLYLRSDGSSTTTRAYINNSAGSGTTWTAITTAA